MGCRRRQRSRRHADGFSGPKHLFSVYASEMTFGKTMIKALKILFDIDPNHWPAMAANRAQVGTRGSNDGRLLQRVSFDTYQALGIFVPMSPISLILCSAPFQVHRGTYM